jgi:hypothetical protein
VATKKPMVARATPIKIKTRQRQAVAAAR